MKNKIKIVNLLITRRCNLQCNYCRIALTKFRDYILQPSDYPSVLHYSTGEHDGQWWCDALDKIKAHNPECFIIVYGGEPFLYNDLAMVVKHLNKIDLPYTLISSCNGGIQQKMDDFFDEMGDEIVRGFTASIDPILVKDYADTDKDELAKTHRGFSTLLQLIADNKIIDPVAEITADSKSIYLLEDLCKLLTEEGIWADITVIDIAKNNYYDFSAISNPEHLVHPTDDVLEIFKRLKASDYMIHMKDTLLDKIMNTLPANVNCGFEKNLHNISIEPTGEMRTCLRIRGIYSPKFSINDIFDSNNNITKEFHEALSADKESLCEGCSWSCVEQSKEDSDSIINH